MNPYRLRAYLLLLIVAIIWGAAGPIIKFTLGGIAPLPFLTYRFALSSLAAVITIFLTGSHLPRSKKTLKDIFIYGFLVSTVALGLLFLGLDKTTVLDMALITSTSPLLVALAGVLFLNEHITRREKLGIGIAFGGTLLTVLEPLFTDGINLSQLTGNLAVFAYLVVNAASAVLVKRLLRQGVKPLTLTNFSFIVGFLTITPLLLVSQSGAIFLKNLLELPPAFHLGVFYMALVSGNLAYTLWNRGQRSIEIGEAAIFGYLYPVFSAPLAVIWLKEKITTGFIAGAILIAIGVVIAEYKKRR